MASPSSTAAFAPADRPSVAIAADGTLAAILEPSRITIIEIPSCASFAELGIDADSIGSEMAWVGTPPRLVVLSRYPAHTSVHLVDPLGPRSIAEIRLEASLRLLAAVGAHAVVAGASGVAVLTASERTLTPHQFPARAMPIAAGAAGSNVVVALAGAIEEWDPQTRMPKRRLKLPRPATITAVGGSDRVVWLTTQQEPARLDVVPLVNRGQPKAHDLPEPIASVSSHPRCDIVACVGATTGRIYVVDLDGRSALRVIAAPGIERAHAVGLALGRTTGVLVAQAERAVTLVSLDRADEVADATAAPPPAAIRKSAVFGISDDPVEPATTVTLASPGGVESTRPSRQVLVPPIAASIAASTAASAADKLQPPSPMFSTSAQRSPSASMPRPPSAPPPTGDSRAVAETQPFPFAPPSGVPMPPSQDQASGDRTSDAGSSLLRADGSGRQRSSPPPPLANGRAIDDTQPPELAHTPRASTPPPTKRDSRSVAETQLPSFGAADGEDSAGIPLPPVSDARAVDETQPLTSFAAAPRAAPLQPRASSVPPPVIDARAVDDTVPPPSYSAGAASRDLAAFRARVDHPRARTDVPFAPLWPDVAPEWRDDLIAWAQRVRGGEAEPPPASPVDMLATRFELSALQGVAVARIYAEHLLGVDGVAPVDVANMFERDGDASGDHWSEALGRGDLARRGLATYTASRVRLADIVVRALDELPPRAGVLVGVPGVVSLLGACVIVAAGPLPIIAQACMASINGAILAAHPEADPAQLVAEARVYGAAPLWRVRAQLLDQVAAEQPIILVVDDDATAAQLGVPRLT